MEISKFKDLLENIAIVRNMYSGTEQELMEEEVCIQESIFSMPNLTVGIRKAHYPLAVVGKVFL